MAAWVGAWPNGADHQAHGGGGQRGGEGNSQKGKAQTSMGNSVITGSFARVCRRRRARGARKTREGTTIPEGTA